MKQFGWLLILLMLSISGYSQIGVGEWRAHLPYFKPHSVVETKDKIVCATGQALFYYSKTGNNVEKLNKVNGLSDVEVTSIAYDDLNDLLLVGYKNGNFDMIKGTTVYNIPAIKNKLLTGNKNVNSILVYESEAFLACGFGIVRIDLLKKEVKDTYLIGDLGSFINVNQISINGSYIYAATDNGIFKADFYTSNLADFSFWEIMTNIPNFTGSFNSIVSLHETVITNFSNESYLNDEVYVYDGFSWSLLESEDTLVHKLHVSNNSLAVISIDEVRVYNTGLNLQNTISNYNNAGTHPTDAIIDATGTTWMSDNGSGLVRYNGSADFIIPNGPYTHKAFTVATQKEHVYVTAGGVSTTWGNVYTPGMFYLFNKEQWSTRANYDVNDIVSITIDPFNDNHLFASSWGDGVLEYRNGELENHFDENNSSLQAIPIKGSPVRVRSMDFDADRNLWMSNSEVNNPISVLMTDGAWRSFDFDDLISNELCGELIYTEAGHIWMVLPKGGGLFVFDPNNTPSNDADDQFMKLPIVNEVGASFTNDIYSIAEDNDGNIWVGTNQGVLVYYNPHTLFDEGKLLGNRIKLTIDGHTQYLLQNEVVTAIEVNGANQKWFGTSSSGVFLISEDGSEPLKHFTEDNSPLLSNNILDIGINHESGEVFFATDKGLVSYRGSATMGNEDFKDVYVYPNPVRSNYDGDITIRGLISEANVKITDISGNLVYETTAEGGQAVWNGKTFGGSRVNTGVYLVFCTNDDGSKTHITKLLFIK